MEKEEQEGAGESCRWRPISGRGSWRDLTGVGRGREPDDKGVIMMMVMEAMLRIMAITIEIEIIIGTMIVKQ